MTTPYGPWATAIDAGRNPQLSSFWRQRLTMLVPASQTSPVLSKRSLLGLVAAAALVCALPTFRAATAVAEQEKASNKKTSDAENASGVKAAAAAAPPIVSIFDGTLVNNSGKGELVITSGGPLLPEPSMSPSHPNDLDFPFYNPLLNPRTRAELHLSAEQEQKLHELNHKYLAESRPTTRKRIQELDKATANSPPEEKNGKMSEMWAEIRQEARPVRQQVEAILTPEQLTKLRMLALVDRFSPVVLLYDINDTKAPPTEKHKKEIGQLFALEAQFQVAASEKIVQADRENDEKALAILTPPQREQLERQVREGEFGMPIIFGQQLHFLFTTPPGVGHVDYPPLWEFQKELGLNSEQLNKLAAIDHESQFSRQLYELYTQPPDIQPKPENGASPGKPTEKANKEESGNIIINSGTANSSWANASSNLPQFSPQLEQKMMQPGFRQKAEDLKKRFRQEIEAALTPQQLATLKKLALQKAIARRARDPEIPADLHPTEQQKTEMYRLFEANAEVMQRLLREGREKFVDALSPQQRQKCFERLERQEWSCW